MCDLTLTISPKAIAGVLALIVLALILAHVSVEYVRFFYDHDFQLGVERQFNLDDGNNVPSWYTTSILLLAAVLLTVIGMAKKRSNEPFALYWFILAGIFIYLSLDRAASLYSTAKTIREGLASADGSIPHIGVVVGLTVVVLVAITFHRFLDALPHQTKVLFLIAGGLYVGGAIVMEVLTIQYVTFYGANNFTFEMFVVGEEGLEMLGIVVFLYALLSYVSLCLDGVRFRIGDGSQELPLGIFQGSLDPEAGHQVGASLASSPAVSDLNRL